MPVEIVQARPDHSVDKVAELIWSVDVPLMDFLFQGRQGWDRMLSTDWPEDKGLVCHSRALLAIDDGEIVGILLGHDPVTLDAHFEKSMERWKQTETPSLAAHLNSAFTMMDRLFPHPPFGSYYILDLAVDPASQKGGIGRQLMNAAIERALSLGRTSLQLDVEGENAALHFYKRIGMEIEVETRVPYLANNHGIGLHCHMIMPVDPSG